MAKTAPIPSTAPEHRLRRLRTGVILALLAGAVLVPVCVLGLDWSGGPAMLLGELLGLLTPLAVFGVAAVLLHALWRRIAAG